MEVFLRQGIGENLTLDYKRELSPDKDRFKLFYYWAGERLESARRRARVAP